MVLTMKLQPQDNKHLFGLVVFDYDKEYKIDQSINSLKQINYDKQKYKIILSTKYNNKASELFAYIQDFKNEDIISEFIITFDDRINIETEAYQKCIEATYIVKMQAGDIIDPNLFNQINESIEKNNDLIAFEKNNIKAIEFATANDFYLNYNDFDDLFESLKKEGSYKNLNEE